MSELPGAIIGGAVVFIVGLIAAFVTIRAARIQRAGAEEQAQAAREQVQVAREQADVARQHMAEAHRIAIEQAVNARRAQRRAAWSGFLIAADRSRAAARQFIARSGTRDIVSVLRDQYLQAMANLHDAMAVGEIEGPADVSEHAEAMRQLLDFIPNLNGKFPDPQLHPGVSGNLSERIEDLYDEARRSFILAAHDALNAPEHDARESGHGGGLNE
ncbi:hypothetical protein ACFWYW_46415 [Nonomuraea sp. NPDC059023]|uniref:hypothetical protein n=1 Tax=unclassified Nonomuraea TaxID=2593643 RepID=UPI0036803783